MTGVVQYLRGNHNDPEIVQGGPSSLTTADKAAKCLGWFSIALGLTEIFAGRRLARAFGLEEKQGLVRVFGAREIGAGVMTLSLDKDVGLWSRVGGDVMDLLLVATALDSPRRYQRRNAKIALLAIGGITVIDILTARAVGAQKSRTKTPKQFEGRSGFPKGLEGARGAAKDFCVPADMRNSVRAPG
jgi:hypothetical protein